MKHSVLSSALALVLCGFATGVASAAPKAPKWLVLDPITYQSGVDRRAFDGIDQLLLTKLVQAKKYKCLDRDAYRTAAREEGFGAKVELVPAGYSMRGEVVQILRTGKSRTVAGTSTPQYVATVSLRANDLRTQQAYEAETLRVSAYCQTPKDMLVHVVRRVALAILMRDFPLKIVDCDGEDNSLTLNYGADFLNRGEQYEVRKRTAIEDEDSGETIYKEKVVGLCEVKDVGQTSSEAELVNGKAKRGHILRFYEDAEPFAVPPAAPAAAARSAAPASAGSAEIVAKPRPAKRQRIAVAPFISKSNTFSVWGMQIASRTWMDDVKAHLNTFLTQSESFIVLDRTFGPEVDRELNRIVNDPNAKPEDVCRLSHKLAADYLVVAEVVFSNVASPGTDFATGLPLPPPSANFAEVRYRCVVAPTTQIALADTAWIDSSRFGGTAEQFSSASAAACALQIMRRIQERLAPADFQRAQEAAAAAAATQTQQQAPASAPAPSQGVNLGF